MMTTDEEIDNEARSINASFDDGPIQPIRFAIIKGINKGIQMERQRLRKQVMKDSETIKTLNEGTFFNMIHTAKIDIWDEKGDEQT